MLDGELLVPIPETGGIQIGVRTLDAAEDVSLVVVEDREGRTVLPAFTSERELARWRPQGSPYIAFSGRVLIEMLATSDWDRVVVDGAGARPIAMTRDAARELLGVESRSIAGGSTFFIGQPAQPAPDALVEVLRSLCARPDIEEAYLYQFQLEGEDAPYLALGVLLSEHFDESRVESAVHSLGTQIEPESFAGTRSSKCIPWRMNYSTLHGRTGSRSTRSDRGRASSN